MPRNDRVEGEIIPTRITNMQSIVEIDPCFFFFSIFKDERTKRKTQYSFTVFFASILEETWSGTLGSVVQIHGIVFM